MYACIGFWIYSNWKDHMLNICPKYIEKVWWSSLLIIKNQRTFYFIITLLFSQIKIYKVCKSFNFIVRIFETKIVTYFDKAIEFNVDGKDDQMEYYVL